MSKIKVHRFHDNVAFHFDGDQGSTKTIYLSHEMAHGHNAEQASGSGCRHLSAKEKDLHQ